ncbi:Zinc finger protein Pegasus [Branchiostoma belcheri]|nr:Zinc finger protein Pegasus [Branchiostoma belcheri]
MEGQPDSTKQEGGVKDNNKISTEGLVSPEASEGTVSELVQNIVPSTSAIQTSEEQPASEETPETNSTNIQGLDIHGVEDRVVISQDSAGDSLSLKLDCTPEKGGDMMPRRDSSGHPENDMFAEGHVKPTASRESSCSDHINSVPIDGKRHTATDPNHISEQITDLKDLSETESLMASDQKKSDKASLEPVPAKYTSETEGAKPGDRSVNSTEETDLGTDTTVIPEPISETITVQSSVSPKENVTRLTDPATDCQESIHNVATTEEVTESNISDQDNSVKLTSVQKSTAEQNMSVKESCGATGGNMQIVRSSNEDTTSASEQVGSHNSVKGNGIGHDVSGEDYNETSGTLQAESSVQDKSINQQEENISTRKEGSEEHEVPYQSKDGKSNVIAAGQNDLQMSGGETPMIFSEKDMTEEDLADISEFDSTTENVPENVTLNSATELEASEGQMDSLTFETGAEDGDPDSSQSSLEAPTCHLDLGLPTLEMPLGENRISMYSDGDDSQQFVKKIRQEDELDKDAVSNGKDNIKDKKEEEKLESRCGEKEVGALVDALPASSTESPIKDINLNFGTFPGVHCTVGQPSGEHFLTEKGSCNSNTLTPSDTNENKIEDSLCTLSAKDIVCPLDLTTALNGTKEVTEQEARSAARAYVGRSMWDAVKPTENIQHKTEPVFPPKPADTKILQFWKKTFQCKYCSYHAQSQAAIKHHTQEKHTKKHTEEQKGKELPRKKDEMETREQVQNPAGQDQAFLSLVIPSVKKQETLSEENKGEEDCVKHKEVHEDKEAHSTTKNAPKTAKGKTGQYKCTHCPYQTNSIKGLCGHMAVHAKKVKCKKCDFVGKSVKDLQKHLIQDHRCSNSSVLGIKKRSHVVRVTESSGKTLGKQALKHKARKSLPPPASNVIFNNVESVTEEQDVDVSRVFVNHKTYPNGCTYCPYTSISLSELRAHMQHHQAASGLPCTFCSYKAKDKPTLMSHIEVHYAGFAYKCNHCGFLSPTQEQALHHFDSICESKPKHKTSSPSKKKCTKEASPSKGQKRLNSKNKSGSPKKDADGKNSKNKPVPDEKDESTQAQDMSGDVSDDSDIITILQEPPKYSYQCPHCPFTVTGKAKLNLHIAGHSKQDGHKCTLCNFRVTSEAKLSKHLRVHQMIGRFKCKHCRFWSIYKDRVKLHLQTECKLKGTGKGRKSVVKVEQKEAVNTWTSREDETNSDIVSMVKDPNQYPHRCPHCPFSSASPTQIESHISQHFREEGAQCDECTFWAISDGMLRKHKRVHQKLGKYKCKHCAYWSWYREKVLTHLEKCKHNPGRTATEEETVEPDNTAKEKAENKAKRESYSRWDDSEDEDIVVKVKKSLRTGHKCPHCPFVASNIGKLSIHLPNHDRTDGVKCPKCTFRAGSEQLLGFHKRVHQRGVRTYHCTHCTFWSWYKDRVQKHLEKGCPQKKAENPSSNEEKNSGKRPKKEPDTKSAKKESDLDEELSTSRVATDDNLTELTDETTSSLGKASEEIKGEEEMAGEEFTSSPNLDDHIIMIEQEAEARYGLKCPHCPLTTASTDCYQQHLARHELKEGIKCDQCSFRALTTGRLQVHKKVHAKKYMYQCKHCVFIADNKFEVAQHLGHCVQKIKRDQEARERKESDEVVVSRGIRQYSMNCPHCPYTTGNSRCMKAHQQRHMNQDGIQCERCSFNALSPGKMAKHMKVHQTGGGFKCKYCMFFSSYRSHVLQHLKLCRNRASQTKKEAKGGKEAETPEEKAEDLSTKSESLHDGVEKDDIGPCSEIEILKPGKTSNYKHNCSYCPHTALSPASLEPHIQRHFVNDGPKCKFCTYRALSASGLYGHERLHWRGCFKCKYCAYLAPHRRRVLEHLEECPGRRILSVSIQDPKEETAKDMTVSAVNTDTVSQTEEGKGQKRKDLVEVSDRDVVIAYRKQTVKQHKCPHCPYSASGPALLEPHVVRHSDTGSGFKCDLCNYRAASFGWLNNHRKVHQDGYYYKCNYCAYWSPVKDEVLSHVARKHHMGSESEEKKMKVDGPLSVEAAAVASQVPSNAGRAAAPSLMDTVKRLGEALRSSPVPMAFDAQTKNDRSAVLLSQDKTAQEALKRKEGGDKNLVMTLKKRKTENGEAVWQAEENKVCPYNECKKRFESASAFVTHLAEHSGTAQTPNTSGQLPQPTQQPSVQSVQQLFTSKPSQQPPSQHSKQVPTQHSQQPPLQQPSQQPSPQLPSQQPPPQLPSQQPPSQLPSQQPPPHLPSQQPPPQLPSQQPPPQQPSQQPSVQLLPSQQTPARRLPSQQPLPATQPLLQQAGLVRPPANVGANQQAVLSQGQAVNPQNRQVFLVSGLQQNLGGFALFVPYTSGAQPAPQTAGGSVVTSVVQSPHPTQASTVSQSTVALTAQATSRPPDIEHKFDLSNHVTQTWRGDFLCKYCSYTTQHCNIISRHHITEDWRSGVFSCNYCPFATTAKNILSRHVKKHLPQGAAGSRGTPDSVGTPHATQTWRGDFTCNHCGYVAQFKQIMSRHVKQHLHPGKSPKRAVAAKDLTLTDHIQVLNIGQQCVYLCKYCDYQAAFKSHVSRHVKKHLALGVSETATQPSVSVSPAASAAQSQQEVPVVPETTSSSGGSRGASPGNPSSATSPPPDGNMTGVDVEGRWWTTKFRCKHCSFSTRYKHQIEEHMQTHSPAKTEQGQQVSPGTTQDKITTPPPPCPNLSPPVQTVPSSPSSGGVVSSSANAVVSSASSTVTSPPPPTVVVSPPPPSVVVSPPPPAVVVSPPPPAVVVSPPPLPSSPPSGLPASSRAPGAVVDTSGRVTLTSGRRFVFYQCKFCQFTGHRKEEIIKHAMDVHPGETPPLTNQGTPYRCRLCHYYTQSNAALQVHMKRHDNRDFPYICTHCKFAGASRADLEEHSRKHITMGRGSGRIRNVYFTIFKCPYCTFTSRVSTLMQGHLTTWHSTNTIFRFCFKCDLEFSNHEDMDRHMLLYHGGRAALRHDMYKRDSPTSASPAISSEGSQVDDSEPLPLLWKSADRQAVKNSEGPLSLVTTAGNRAEEGTSLPVPSLSQTDDSDVEFISETPATNSTTDTHKEQSEKQEDVTNRGGVSNDGGVVDSSQENTDVETPAQEDSSIGKEHTSPQARRMPSVSAPDDDDDDVMASPPSSPDLKAVTDLMEELSDSEIISEDSTDPFGHHHSTSLPETSTTKISSAEGATAETTSEEVTNTDSGSLGKPNGEQENTGTDKDAEKSDTGGGGGGALMVSRVHPLQSGLVGSVEPASRSSLAGQQNWPAPKTTSSDFQGSGSSTQSESAGSEVGRQVKGTALVACVSVSPQTNPTASGNSRSESEAPSGAAAGYRCNHCGVRFGDFLMYSIHGGFHHQENPFTCNICKHTATDRYQFNLHFTSAKHARLMDSSPLGAMAASLGVLSRGAPAPNTTPALTNGDPGYHCIHCSMTFDDFLLYSIHSGFHSQHHPFMCNICGQDCEDRFQFVMHFAKSDHS